MPITVEQFKENKALYDFLTNEPEQSEVLADIQTRYTVYERQLSLMQLCAALGLEQHILFLANQLGHERMVEAVKADGAGVIFEAARYGQLNTLKQLFSYLAREDRQLIVEGHQNGEPQYIVVNLAILNKHPEVSSYLLKTLDKDNRVAAIKANQHRILGSAVFTGHKDLVRKLLSELTLEEKKQAASDSFFYPIATALRNDDLSMLNQFLPYMDMCQFNGSLLIKENSNANNDRFKRTVAEFTNVVVVSAEIVAAVKSVQAEIKTNYLHALSLLPCTNTQQNLPTEISIHINRLLGEAHPCYTYCLELIAKPLVGLPNFSDDQFIEEYKKALDQLMRALIKEIENDNYLKALKRYQLLVQKQLEIKPQDSHLQQMHSLLVKLVAIANKKEESSTLTEKDKLLLAMPNLNKMLVRYNQEALCALAVTHDAASSEQGNMAAAKPRTTPSSVKLTP